MFKLERPTDTKKDDTPSLLTWMRRLRVYTDEVSQEPGKVSQTSKGLLRLSSLVGCRAGDHDSVLVGAWAPTRPEGPSPDSPAKAGIIMFAHTTQGPFVRGRSERT